MPRKSDIGTEAKDGGGIGAAVGGGAGGGASSKEAAGLSIDDHTLPKSIVTRLAKGVLPQHTNVQKDAILALSKGGTVFINYLCATANDTAKNQGRKMINPKDILEAMQMMEFDDFVPRLEAELAKFNEIVAEKRAATKKPAKPKEGATKGHCTSKHSPSEVSNNGNDSPPAPKKMRVGAVSDPGSNQAKTTMLSGNSVPVRRWGDEDEEEDEEMGDEEDEEMGDEEDEEIEEVEETESEGPDEDGSETPDEVDAEGGNDQEEDEALDNGVNSD